MMLQNFCFRINTFCSSKKPEKKIKLEKSIISSLILFYLDILPTSNFATTSHLRVCLQDNNEKKSLHFSKASQATTLQKQSLFSWIWKRLKCCIKHARPVVGDVTLVENSCMPIHRTPDEPIVFWIMGGTSGLGNFHLKKLKQIISNHKVGLQIKLTYLFERMSCRFSFMFFF